jgi:hypothetical protein
MSEELETVLRLVADGALTPEQAAPIIEALSRAERAAATEAEPEATIDRHMARARRAVELAHERTQEALGAIGRGRQLRIRVTERGRQVVNLRIPVGLVDAALTFIPGIGREDGERIRQAVRSGEVGPILDVEDPDGDGVLISVE